MKVFEWFDLYDRLKIKFIWKKNKITKIVLDVISYIKSYLDEFVLFYKKIKWIN